MKILKITFLNLNSLKGQHSIDFENGLLGQAGIFAITGPTGAGKSTLLDAITLALFGKAARYEKEPNPGEVMTRGTGECAAEVLFSCRQGRFSVKWNLARARKKPDGKLQSAKREIADALSGKILAEKITETNALLEQLTGLDYHRFLRSVLLAQGRFKEFLDANDNERGDLLEKITGTEIYSNLSKKAFEFERLHDNKIKEAQQKLDNLELQSPEALSALNEEKASLEANSITLKTQRLAFQTQQKHFENYQRLTLQLQQSKTELSEWEKANIAFNPSRDRLARHVATFPFQTALFQLENDRNALNVGKAALLSLQQDTQSNQALAAQRLTRSIEAINLRLAALSQDLQSSQSQSLEKTNEANALRSWLEQNQADLAIEDQLPDLRRLGESIRQSDNHLQRLQANLQSLNLDHLKNDQLIAQKQKAVTSAQSVFDSAQAAHQTALEAFNLAAEEQSLDLWRDRANALARSAQNALQLKDHRSNWLKANQALTDLQQSRPSILQHHSEAVAALQSQNDRVLKEESILADKQTIWNQSRLIASLESHRAALNPNEACPLCGSLDHPFARHLQSDEDATAQDLQRQKTALQKARSDQQAALATFNRLDEQLKAHDLLFKQTSSALQSQTSELQSLALRLDYLDPLDNDAAFSLWFTQIQSQVSTTQAKLKNLERLDLEQRNTQSLLTKLDASLRVSISERQNAQDEKTKLSNAQKALEAERIALQEKLQAQLAQFNQHLGPHLPPAQSPADTSERSQSLENKLRSYNTNKATSLNLQNTLKELAGHLKELTQERSNLSAEAKEYQAALDDLPPLNMSNSPSLPSPAIPDTEAQRRLCCQELLKQARDAQLLFNQKDRDLIALSQKIKGDVAALNTRLQGAPFDSIQALADARLSDQIYQSLITQKDALKSQHDQLTGKINQSLKALKDLESSEIISPEQALELNAQLAQLDQQINNHHSRLGEINLQLKQDDQARRAHADQIKQIARLQELARPWIELNALIGSASGDKFSKFAQGLTLSQLLQLANQHLLDLNDRYYIQQSPLSELSLHIVDRYQADAIRPTRSLSGGESFLVSLALALGLSDLAGSDTRIESLFIDEGFGSLDTETLDIALAALENLRMGNRTIGIISHVDALKHRISAQIQVSKSSNGFGSLQIINGI